MGAFFVTSFALFHHTEAYGCIYLDTASVHTLEMFYVLRMGDNTMHGGTILDDGTLQMLKRQLDIAKEALQQLNESTDVQRQHLQSQASLAVSTAKHLLKDYRA